jgi:AAA domain
MKSRVGVAGVGASTRIVTEIEPEASVEDDSKHPIERRDYLLTTPAIKALFDQLCEWIEFRTPGAIIAGRPRLGKTRAIEALVALLARQLPGLPTHWLSCEDHEQTTERTFFEDALRDSGHSYVREGTARDKRNRFIELLVQSALDQNESRVVVFADEAQRLRERQYNWLVDVHNALDRRGVAMMVFLIGQPELIDVRAGLLQANKHQIVNRFMVDVIQLRGISSAAELGGCLAAFDAKRWPRVGGCSYPAYFLPEAARSGWKLKDIAEELWECFDASRRADRRGTRMEVSMFHFCRTIEILLTGFASQARREGVVSKLAMKEAIKRSGFIVAEAFSA